MHASQGTLFPKTPFFSENCVSNSRELTFIIAFFQSQREIVPVSWYTCIYVRQVCTQEKLPTA